VSTSAPFVGAGIRRVVPERLDAEQRERLRWLLDDPDTWVLRPGWEPFLLRGSQGLLVATDDLTADQRQAALAWLRQQRHTLHRALEGGIRAPDGWLEALPLVRRLQGGG
jgi:hypothetical protein